MGKRYKEIFVGVGAAFVVLALIYGFDFTMVFLPLSLVGLVAVVLSRQGALQGRFSVADLAAGDESKVAPVTFADIGGQETAKREFLEALLFLKESGKLNQLGIRPLRGVLLAGPPGTGKTLMAKAAANYTDSVFVSASGSQFVQMYAGVGASRVRQLFKQARSLAQKQGKTSAIIFIDEIDVLGAKRGQNHSHMEYDQTLNELLTQIDGVESEHAVRVLVVGATNRVDLLDPALLRPGRFDRVVQVDLPDKEGRLHILKIHAKNKPLAPEVDLEKIATEAYGFSGAHLESLLNEAAINALRDEREMIGEMDLREAIEKVMLGEKSNRTPHREELERVAFHEVGHALIQEHVRPGSVASVTVTPRSNALGYMRQNPGADKYLYTRDELCSAIEVCVAGAVSEELMLGQRSTGALGDIEKATELAEKMVFAGLSPLGIVGSHLPKERLHMAVTEIIQGAEVAVKACLGSRKELIKKTAQRLLKQETLGGEELRSYIEAS